MTETLTETRCGFDGCETVLMHTAGPQKPRWCAEHREEGERAYKREQQRIARQRQREAIATPPVHCEGCETRLRQPSGDGLCGFCQIELFDAMAEAA